MFRGPLKIYVAQELITIYVALAHGYVIGLSGWGIGYIGQRRQCKNRCRHRIDLVRRNLVPHNRNAVDVSDLGKGLTASRVDARQVT